MLHTEYERLRTALQTGLRAIGLERHVEIDGPNRLGGFRISDGVNRVALSFAPSRKKDDREAGRHWWVSAWVPIADGYDGLLMPDLIPVAHRREVLLKKPLDTNEATVAALQLFTELRVRAALTRVVETPEGFPMLPVPPPTGPALGDTVFGTAPNRADRESPVRS